ncbi:MAG: MBL fold metallo-hydrolase [Hyphomonadaceae bacterium]
MMLPMILALALEGAPPPAAPPPREIAAGVTLLPGGFLPGRGPDGNSVIFDGRDGLIVVDTGRHAWHSDAIIAYAQSRARPVTAIVNTHWHLDHSSGNGRLKAVFPGAQVHATNAVDRVLAPGGFLTRNLDGARQTLGGELSEIQREEVQIFIATMDQADLLRPDITVETSRRMRIGGRRLDVHVTDGAVTDADIWFYDRASRVAVLGDLVTLPAPFFETACPDRWRAALDEVWDTPFRIAIPGHGEPMDRAQFALYRTAFGAFVDCAESEAAAAQCAAAWAQAMAPFSAGGERARLMSAQMAEYYVGFLRENGGKSPDCQAS